MQGGGSGKAYNRKIDKKENKMVRRSLRIAIDTERGQIGIDCWGRLGSVIFTIGGVEKSLVGGGKVKWASRDHPGGVLFRVEKWVRPSQ